MSDLLISSISELATPLGSTPRAGASQGSIERSEQVDVLCRDGRIAFIGSREARIARFGEGSPGVDVAEIDATGKTVIPGFVDAHTHLPWAGSREKEFAQRLAGATYQEISGSGGGILSSVTATRNASEDDLVANTLARLDRMLAHGTTTAEVKSGYGLTLDDELKQLRAIHRAGEQHSLDVVPTLLAAHEFPVEFRDRRNDWVTEICSRIIPAASDQSLAVFCDVFCEQGVFDVDQSRRVLRAGLEHGLLPRLHADEFVDSGAAALAGELRAVSADHLVAVSDAGIEALAANGVLAVLLPAVSFFLMKKSYAPARELIASEVPVILSTDCNPGSSHTESLPFIIQLAVFQMGMTIEECLTAVTLNAACCLGLGAELGTLEVGKQADLTILDEPNLLHLGYHLGTNPVHSVVKTGTLCYSSHVERS